MALICASARGEREQGRVHLARQLLLALLSLLALIGVMGSGARAVDAIVVKPDQDKYDVTSLGELYEGRGDRLQLETAPGPDGYVGRMAVQASVPGTNPGWLVFALTNPTAERVVRWLVAPRYTLPIRGCSGQSSTRAASPLSRPRSVSGPSP